MLEAAKMTSEKLVVAVSRDSKGMLDQFQLAVNEKYLQAIDVNSTVEYYRVLSWIGSIFNIILGWMQRGGQEMPEQMAHICSQFLSEDEWRIGAGIQWNSAADRIGGEQSQIQV